MRIDIATLFPEMCESVFNTSITGRAVKNGIIKIFAHNIRDFTKDKHRNVDDTPYGGGMGMVMSAQPICDCVEHIKALDSAPARVIYLSPKGKLLTQETVRELARESRLILICGHYEGVDERVLEELNAEEISIGDYVLTGGELPALVLTDAVARMIPGVLPGEEAYTNESHFSGLLEAPQYTKPEVWRGRSVPRVLLSGDHKKVVEWREKTSVELTKLRRNDLYQAFFYKRTYPFWREFLREKSPDLDKDSPFGSRVLPPEQMKLLKRGRLGSLPSEDLREGMYVEILDELLYPRFIVLITKIEGNSAYFRTVYKKKGENNG